MIFFFLLLKPVHSNTFSKVRKDVCIMKYFLEESRKALNCLLDGVTEIFRVDGGVQ